MRRALALVLLLGLTLSPASALAQVSPPARDTPAVDVLDPSTVQQIEADVTALSGIDPPPDLAIEVIDDADLAAHLVERVTPLISGQYLDQINAGLDLYALLFDKHEERQQLTTEVLLEALAPTTTTGAAGMYVGDEKTIYVVGDASSGPDSLTVFAHEYTHALQDARYATSVHEQALALDNNADRQTAYRAMVEGDATFTAERWARNTLDEDTVASLNLGRNEASLEGIGRSGLPNQSQQQFLYGAGPRLVRQAFERAGGQHGVAALYAEPPTSTAQVLHPDKYFAHEQPVEVSLPNLTQALGGDWRVVHSNVWGELTLGLLLQSSTPAGTAARAADGWRGDRWVVLAHGADRAAVLKSTWADEAEARDFFDALARSMREQLATADQVDLTPRRQALSNEHELSDLRRAGTDVLLVVSTDRESVPKLISAVGGF